MNITINAHGLELIAAWLADHHVSGTELTADNIRAWAAEAEQNAGNGNGAHFELRAHESIYGRPEIFDVPDDGFGEDLIISRAIETAGTLDRVVELINAGGTCEGMEGVEFSPEQLAGQYAYDAAYDAGLGIDRDNIAGQLSFLIDASAVFDEAPAIEWALKIAAARAE